MGSIADDGSGAGRVGQAPSHLRPLRLECVGQMVDTADTKQLEDALADLKASPDEAKEEHLPLRGRAVPSLFLATRQAAPYAR